MHNGNSYWTRAINVQCVEGLGIRFPKGLIQGIKTFGPKGISYRYIMKALMILAISRQSVISAILKRMQEN